MRKLSFSSHFKVDKSLLDDLGYLDISLLGDLPLFVDPFLIFSSEKTEYQELTRMINRYLFKLYEISKNEEYGQGLYNSMLKFSEVPYNWLGYCKFGNKGNGVGEKFGYTLFKNISNVVNINQDSTKTNDDNLIQKISLIDKKIGADNISDFIVNITKSYFLEITEDFARNHIPSQYCKLIPIDRAIFNYENRRWETKNYYLPIYDSEPVILTPLDILTKDVAWVDRGNMLESIQFLVPRVPNVQLRYEINEYINSLLSKEGGEETISKESKDKIYTEVINEYPVLIDEYISYREDSQERANLVSNAKMKELNDLLNSSNTILQELRHKGLDFKGNLSYHEAMERVLFLKRFIEDNDGYLLFYNKNDNPSGKVVTYKEKELQLLFKLVCFDTISDVNSEVNNGRGPVDFKFSNSANDKSLIEFKLAKNNKLKQNLLNQLDIYKKANDTEYGITVIIFFNDKEEKRVDKILGELELQGNSNIILINAKLEDKISASNVV